MAGASLPTSRSFWGQAIFISGIAILAAYNVKQNIHMRKKAQYRPDELEISRGDAADNYDISKIRPGFPTSESSTERKSEYEGTADSYLTKKRGDKFSTGIWGK